MEVFLFFSRGGAAFFDLARGVENLKETQKEETVGSREGAVASNKLHFWSSRGPRSLIRVAASSSERRSFLLAQ